MKKLPGVLFLLCLAAATSARADAVISGSVSSQVFYGGPSCSQSGGPASSLSLSCSDPSVPLAFSTLTASLGSTTGSVQSDINSAGTDALNADSRETVSFDLSVTGTYMLTGGTGYGYADLVFGPDIFGEYMGSGCDVTLGTKTQSCEFPGTLDFYVPYNTPLNLDLQMDYLGVSIEGDEAGGTLTYNLGALTPMPTPEPASLLLLGTGLVPLMMWKRRRA